MSLGANECRAWNELLVRGSVASIKAMISMRRASMRSRMASHTSVGLTCVLGFSLAAYPFDVLIPGIRAMRDALAALRRGERAQPAPEDVAALWEVSGFNAYLRAEKLVAARRGA